MGMTESDRRVIRGICVFCKGDGVGIDSWVL